MIKRDFFLFLFSKKKKKNILLIRRVYRGRMSEKANKIPNGVFSHRRLYSAALLASFSRENRFLIFRVHMKKKKTFFRLYC